MKTSWGGVAGWYDKVVNDYDSYQARVLLPNILRIVAPKHGEKILDLACGQGYFSHALAAEGAQVTGVDIAPELIDIAKKHADHNEEFLVSSADNLSAFADMSFDVVVCVLAIQNIERMAEAFRQVSRVVRAGGRFVLVLNHPSFRIPGKSSWGFDEKADTQYRRVDVYMSESRVEIDMEPGRVVSESAAACGRGAKEVTYSFHRPLQAYFKSLANAGFAVLRLEEWMSHKESEQGPRKAAEDRARREFPMFLCIECRKER
ncbi:MAG TPA: class I SAM-dependent methyltransferase [Candidatus Paceibacterota bacterium]